LSIRMRTHILGRKRRKKNLNLKEKTAIVKGKGWEEGGCCHASLTELVPLVVKGKSKARIE